MLTRSREALLLDKTAPSTNHKWFRLVTLRKDAHGTVILPDGGDLSYHRANPLFLWMHQSGPSKSRPIVPGPEVAIGTVEDYEQTPSYLDILVRFDDKHDMGRVCRDKVSGGFIRSCSVGFDLAEDGAKEVEVSEEDAARWPGTVVGERLTLIHKWVLLEASLVLIGSNSDALAYLRALPETKGERGDSRLGLNSAEPDRAAPTFHPEVGNVSQERSMAATRKINLSSEARWGYRTLISYDMDTAEGHLRVLEFAPEEHKAHHRGHAMQALDRAAAHAEMLRQSEPDGDEMSRSRRLEIRALPEKMTDTELKTRFNALASDLKSLEIQPLSSVCMTVLGTSDSDEVDAKLTALVETQARYRKLKDERQAQADDVESAAREKKIIELEGIGLSPANATRARKEKWALTKLATLEADLRKDGPPVDIVRTRPLNPVNEQGNRGAVSPAVLIPQERSANPNPQVDEGADAFASFAKDMGLDPEKVRKRYVQSAEDLTSGKFRRPMA